MKKILTLLIIAVLSVGFACGVSAADGISVVVDGAPLEFDVPPVIVNDRTMVPMRAIFESLGATVAWDGENRRVEAIFGDGAHILLTIDSTTAYKNNEAFTLDAAPFIENGRTMVPVRFIGEASGALVGWLAESRTVKVTPSWKYVDFIPFGEYLTIPSPVGVSRDFAVLSYTKDERGAVAVFDTTNITEEEIVKYKDSLVKYSFVADTNDLSADNVVFAKDGVKLTTEFARSAKTFTVIIGR